MEHKEVNEPGSTVALTAFATERHFGPDGSAGTVITSHSPRQFEDKVCQYLGSRIVRPEEGYADFCKLAFVINWTNARAGTMPITPLNERLLNSGYKARTKDEMPVLTRWFEWTKAPKAIYLCVVLYTAEQLAKEGNPVNTDFGIVAILGQLSNQEEPMSPTTMWRNALGVSAGGSGVALDPKAYAKSVEFWQTNAIIGIPGD